MDLILSPIEYFADPTKFGTIRLGELYIGEPDTDPEVVGNQKTVNYQQEDGTFVPIAQPIELSSGGVPMYDGSYISLYVDGDYSMKVLDHLGSQVYYANTVSSFSAESILPTATERQVLQKGATLWEAHDKETIYVTDYGAVGDGLVNDWGAISTAKAAALALGTSLTFPAGTYRISEDQFMTVPWIFVEGASISMDVAKTLTCNALIVAEPTQVIFEGSGSYVGTRDTGQTEIYARWLGVPQNDITVDSATECQAAIDLAQDLECYIDLPMNGLFRVDSTINIKQGRDSAGDNLVMHPLVHGNFCQIQVNIASGAGITLVPQCLESAAGSGDGHSEIDIHDIWFSPGPSGTINTKALIVSAATFWISPLDIGKIENLSAHSFESAPFRVNAGCRNIKWERIVTTGTTSGGLSLYVNEDNFVGDMTFSDCEFEGNDTYKGLSIYSGTAGRVAGLRFNDCIFYGDGNRALSEAGSYIYDTWFEKCSFDGPLWDAGTAGLLIQATGTGRLNQIVVDTCYFVGKTAQANTLIHIQGSAATICEDIRLTNNRFSQCETAVRAVFLEYIENVRVRGNSFMDNLCASEIQVDANCDHIVLQNNASVGNGVGNKLILLSAGCDNLLITGNTTIAPATVISGAGVAATEYIGLDNLQMTV